MKNANILVLPLILLYTINSFTQTKKIYDWCPLECSYISDTILYDLTTDKSNGKISNHNWISIGPESNDILGIAFGDNDGNIIYAASRDSGIYKTINAGENWIKINNGVTDDFIRAIASHPQNKNIVLAGTWGSGLFRSIDGGNDWDYIDFVTDTTIFDIAYNEKYGDTVFVGTRSNGLYRSLDSGITWQHLSPDTINISALKVIIDPVNPNVIYYSTSSADSTVYKSTNFGNDWNVFYNGDPILSMAIDPQNSNIMYMGGLGDAVHGDSLYKSNDGGITWNKFPIKNSTHIVTDILIDRDNSNNVYLATADSGVFQSSNAGLIWIDLNYDLKSHCVLEIKFNPQITSTVYASTNGGAIYQMDNITTNLSGKVLHKTIDFALYKNFPNPFNSTTNIEYIIGKPSFVSIKIYDVLGQEVATLIQTRLSPGKYTSMWDAASFSSGVYYYQLEVENYTKTNKLILIK